MCHASFNVSIFSFDAIDLYLVVQKDCARDQCSKKNIEEKTWNSQCFFFYLCINQD